MSTTLTNGLKLPDKGSVDWYADMQNNYSILDGAVGTVAEHTTALAGKAPLVHTHVKSDITDFPAYGTTAGTICEGNDSRLSDARTPVAHTHTKSDVTDLLNSNFIPSANNSYDLGSSSYQWKSVYAQSYYYNGTAWGLDKANEWTQNQTVKNGSASYILVNTNVTKGVIPANNRNITFSAKDKNGEEIGRVLTRVTPNGETYTWLAAHNFYKNGALDPTGTEKWANVTCFISSDGSTHVEINSDFIPDNVTTNANLGTSTNKWATLNGINPGALSFFNPSATQDPIDVPNTWVTDGSAWNTLNVSNMGDGWICLTYRLCGTNDYILARFNGANANKNPSMIFPATMLQDSKYYIYLLMPVAKAMDNIYLEINLDSNAVLVKHSFIPAYGTV